MTPENMLLREIEQEVRACGLMEAEDVRQELKGGDMSKSIIKNGEKVLDTVWECPACNYTSNVSSDIKAHKEKCTRPYFRRGCRRE